MRSRDQGSAFAVGGRYGHAGGSPVGVRLRRAGYLRPLARPAAPARPRAFSLRKVPTQLSFVAPYKFSIVEQLSFIFIKLE